MTFGIAFMALTHSLHQMQTPAAVRCAIDAVMERIFSYEDMFDSNGFLQLGVCGHQPDMANSYTANGTLYACTYAMAPLGLSPNDKFWSDPDDKWFAKKVWSGENVKSFY